MQEAGEVGEERRRVEPGESTTLPEAGASLEEHMEELAFLAGLVCETPEATLTLFEDRKQFGAPLDEELEGVVAAAVSEGKELLLVPEARLDRRLAELPSARRGELVFCAGMPVPGPEGSVVGAFVLRDRVRRTLGEQHKRALRSLAREAAAHLGHARQGEQLRRAWLAEQEMTAHLEHHRGLLVEANRLLQELATTDELTGLANRRAVREQMQRLACSDALMPLSLLILDVDHFKRINDTLTHEGGDRVLKHLAGLLRSSFRAGDTVGRYGGEEFAVLLPRTRHSIAMARAEKLRAKVEADTAAGVPVTVSIGVATLEQPTGFRDWERLVAEADRALYAAKRGGRNRVTSAEPPAGEDEARAAGAGLELARTGNGARAATAGGSKPDGSE